MNNVISLASRKTPQLIDTIPLFVEGNVPKELQGPFGATVDEEFVIPEKYVGWLNKTSNRDGVSKLFGYQDEYDAVGIVLNNVCRTDIKGGVHWHPDRKDIVFEVLRIFKGAYIEFNQTRTGITILCKGYFGDEGTSNRGFNAYRFIEVFDYLSEGEHLPLSGCPLTEWSGPAMIECQEQLDWLVDRFMVPDENLMPTAQEEEEMDNIALALAVERNRLLSVVEDHTVSNSTLTAEQQLSVYQTLIDFLSRPEALFPYTLLDGFSDGVQMNKETPINIG